MPHKLFLSPCEPYDARDSRYDWALYDLKGLKVTGGRSSPLDDVQQVLMQNAADNVKASIIWPGNLSFNATVSLPGKGVRYLQKALAYAVEDKVATDIELLHFAMGKSTNKNQVSAHCIEKSFFLGFYDDVYAARPEIRLASAYVDSDLLPMEGFDIVISLEGSWAMVRSSTQSVKIRVSNLVPYLDSILLMPSEDEEGSSNRIKLYDHNANDSEHKLLLAEVAQYPDVELETEDLSISALDLLAESYFHNGAPAIDLCQGDLRIQNEGSGQLKQWSWVAGIAVLAFFVQVGVFIGKGVYYQTQADELGQQALATYKQVVPTARSTSVARLARIIKGKLRQSEAQGADAGFLYLLGEAGYQYQQSSAPAGISFTNVGYSAQRGELVIELEAKTFEQMDQLKNALVTNGLNAKIGSAVQEDNYYRGRLSVRAG